MVCKDTRSIREALNDGQSNFAPQEIKLADGTEGSATSDHSLDVKGDVFREWLAHQSAMDREPELIVRSYGLPTQ
jgi:hypothetical protein